MPRDKFLHTCFVTILFIKFVLLLNVIYIVYVGCAMFDMLRQKHIAAPGVFQLATCHSTDSTK